MKGLTNHTILVRPAGTEIPIQESAAPIKNPGGEIIGAVMVFHDVTERRQKEKALQEEYAITERLHEIAASISTELDLGKVVQTIADAGTRVTRAQFGAFFFNESTSKALLACVTLSRGSRALRSKTSRFRARRSCVERPFATRA